MNSDALQRAREALNGIYPASYESDNGLDDALQWTPCVRPVYEADLRENALTSTRAKIILER